MQKRILFMDNTASFLNANARLLEKKGYTVLKATSVREAEEKLQEQYIHLAIFDVRMEAEDSIHDISGLELVQKEAYRYVPKIILTAYPSWQYAEQALGVALEGKLIGLIDKGNGPDALLEAVEEGFAKHVPVNWQLLIRTNVNGSTSLPHIAALIAGENGRFSPRHSDELEDIFRRLFFGYEQITIQQLFGRHRHKVYLNVSAYSKLGIRKHYLVVCGKRPFIEKELDNYQALAPTSLSRYQIAFEHQEATIRFSAAMFTLEEGKPLDNLQAWGICYSTQHTNQLQAMLQMLFTKRLLAWHEQKRVQKGSQETAIYLLARNHLKTADNFLLKLETKVDQLCAELLAVGMVQIDCSFDELDVHIEKQNLTFVNPIRGLAENWLAADDTHLWGIIHGGLSVHTLLTDGYANVWLINYETAALAPLVMDFADLELTFWLELWQEPDVAKGIGQISQLFAEELLGETVVLSATDCANQKLVTGIQEVRKAKTAVLGKDSDAYAAALFYGALGWLAAYDPTVHHTKSELRPYLYALLVASLLNQRRQKAMLNLDLPPEAQGGIWIDPITEDVWRQGELLELTSSEFRLLGYLYQHQGCLCDNIQIAENVFDVRFPEDMTKQEKLEYEKRRIHTAVSRLRRKIEPEQNSPKYIHTKPNKGYIFKKRKKK
ncbi:MAG: winged helix-turn-helix domain-containing protein [Chloroflexota bacterium]